MFRKVFGTIAALTLSVSLTTTSTSGQLDEPSTSAESSSLHPLHWIGSILSDSLGGEVPTSQADGDGDGDGGGDQGSGVDPNN
ncbi:MAG: hypothetical protein K0U98_12605 [Deltaproteobacteria bacterium]|nr:hypothetical protein [Deltaproteobacteria bacterium]